MQFSPDNNFSLGIAQLLENWSKAGLRLIETGSSATVTEWLASHGESMSFLVSSGNSAVIEAQATKHDELAPREHMIEPMKATVSVPTPSIEKTTSNLVSDRWTSTPLDHDARLNLLAREASQVAQCQKCANLVCSRSRTVYSDGNAMSDIVFVGEGPGAEEDRRGIPFVGAAGQLLDKIIAAMNLKRENVYIMNAVKCRPQNNRTPTDEEISNCQPFFINQLEAIQPKFIVCLGAVAARAVLQTTLGIGRLRGRFYSFRGAKVAVTYHPAYLLRTPEAKKLTWEDMKMVMAAMKG